MSLRLISAVFGFAVFCFADTVTLRNGDVIQGTFVGGDSRSVKIAVGDRINTFAISDVMSIQFADVAPPPPPPPSQPDPPPPPPERNDRAGEYRPSIPQPRPPSDDRYPEPDRTPPPSNAGVLVPAQTSLIIRMTDPVDSQRDVVGQTYRASIDEPVLVDGRTVIRRGADVIVKLVDDKQSGKLEGRTVLTLDLASVEIRGQLRAVDTTDVQQQSSSRGARTGKVVGGTTVLGAILGGIAGGGKGAAIGAASGAAVGTGAEIMTKGQRVRIPSETRLTFVLQQAIME